MQGRAEREYEKRRKVEEDLTGFKARNSQLNSELHVAEARLGQVLTQNQQLIDMVKGQAGPEMIIDKMGEAIQKVFMPPVKEDESVGVDGRLLKEDGEVFYPEHERDPWLEEEVDGELESK